MTPDWVEQLSALTATSEDAARFHTQRTRAATAVAQTIFQTLGIDRKQKIPALYAVWLCGHEQPVYVGQTLDMGRRLWDLPIGESHHLANSFPVEIWQAVKVLRWHDFPAHHKARELEELTQGLIVKPDKKKSVREKKLDLMGMALEYLFQLEYKPLFNMRKRKPDGSWRPVRLEKSKSAGAKTSRMMGDLWPLVHQTWRNMVSEGLSAGQSRVSAFGGLVFWDRSYLFSE
ncbi:MAG: hypothetical protein QNK37_32675 [Acidobacteriota bacterium]|nr:hypothetical protein [Acidobacteriota bacterium]